MARSWIIDLRHVLDAAGLPVEGPPGRLARCWCEIVEAATVRPGDAWDATAARCPSARCPGPVRVRRADATETVEWECATCGDDGAIAGWGETAWDLRGMAAERSGPLVAVRLGRDEYDRLRGCDVIGVEMPVVLAASTPDGDGVELRATEAELDDVLGHVAAEANHTRSRRRRSALDGLYARLQDVLTSRGASPATSAARDAIARGIADVLGLPPAARERYAHVLERVAGDAVLELDLRGRIDALFDGLPVPPKRQLRVALELGELVDRLRATGAARPEAACAAAAHLLGRLRGAADTLPDLAEVRAACADLGETAIALARGARPDRSRLVLAPLLDAYLDDRAGCLREVPAALRRARFGKRLRRWLAAEIAVRSDTADPVRAARSAAILAAVADGG
jgi:hypothetical protein